MKERLNLKIDIYNTEKKYNIIYADPPWKFNNKNTGGSMKSGSANKYKVMSSKDLSIMPIDKIADENCVLIMWWVASMPLEAISLINDWHSGFKLKTMTLFTWLKQTKTGKDHFGMGFQTRQQTESCLCAIKGNIKRINNSVREIIRAQMIKHSKKPDEVKDLIVELYGNLPRIELFAREK